MVSDEKFKCSQAKILIRKFNKTTRFDKTYAEEIVKSQSIHIKDKQLYKALYKAYRADGNTAICDAIKNIVFDGKEFGKNRIRFYWWNSALKRDVIELLPDKTSRETLNEFINQVINDPDLFDIKETHRIAYITGNLSKAFKFQGKENIRILFLKKGNNGIIYYVRKGSSSKLTSEEKDSIIKRKSEVYDTSFSDMEKIDTSNGKDTWINESADFDEEFVRMLAEGFVRMLTESVLS